jgi:hypothetical protein
MAVGIYTHPKMSHTIFHDKDTRNVLFRSRVEFVNFPEQADVLIGNRESLIQDFITKFAASKRYLLWTHEPLFWTSAAKWATISGQRVRTMSLHSGDVFLDNCFYASIKLHRVYRSSSPRKTLNRTVVVVSTAKTQGDPEVTRRADGVDLSKLRYELAMAGHSKRQVHIYGKFWPSGVSRAENRSGYWPRSKYKILEGYDFNLCFENCLVPHYCSEKIWQAVHCGCLPIYFGQQTIYRDFPRDSFLDYTLLNDPDALFDTINRMTCDEFNHRYDNCLAAFQKAYPLGKESRARSATYAALQIIALTLPNTATKEPA